MPKILFLARHLNLVTGGGSSYSLDMVASELTDSGFDVEIQVTDTLQLNNNPSYNVTDLTDTFSDINYASFGRRLYTHLRSEVEKYDLIHVFSPSFLSIAGFVQSKTAVPIVGRLNTYTPFCTNLGLMNGDCHKNCSFVQKSAHDNRTIPKKIIRGPRYVLQDTIEPAYASNLRKFFAISPAVKNIYSEYGYPSEKITVVPNMVEDGIQSVEFNPSKNTSPLSLLYVGRLSEVKGLHYLFEALNGISEYDFDIEIVGKGPELNQLQSLESKLPSNINTTFHGYVNHENLSEYYLNADCFVHPHTWPEPFGRVILEALQYRCPVLCSDIGAPSWIAAEACETFEPKNVSDLRSKLKMVAKQPERLDNMAQNSHSQISRFKKQPIVDQIINEYRKLL